jgi:hypothetical protein
MLPMIAGKVADSSSGDTAAWLGTIGTWLLGIIAAFIAWIQYDHNRFKPQVTAYRDANRRVVVRIANRGAGSGTIEAVHLLTGGHASSAPALLVNWEFAGAKVEDAVFVPFMLPGLSTAQLVMLPIDPITPSTCARVTYANNRKSPFVELVDVDGVVLGSTMIPGAGGPQRA